MEHNGVVPSHMRKKKPTATTTIRVLRIMPNPYAGRAYGHHERVTRALRDRIIYRGALRIQSWLAGYHMVETSLQCSFVPRDDFGGQLVSSQNSTSLDTARSGWMFRVPSQSKAPAVNDTGHVSFSCQSLRSLQRPRIPNFFQDEDREYMRVPLKKRIGRSGQGEQGRNGNAVLKCTQLRVCVSTKSSRQRQGFCSTIVSTREQCGIIVSQ